MPNSSLRRMMMARKSSAPSEWDDEWDYTMGPIETCGFLDFTFNGGTTSMEPDGELLNGPGWKGIDAKNRKYAQMSSGAMEIEFIPIELPGGWGVWFELNCGARGALYRMQQQFAYVNDAHVINIPNIKKRYRVLVKADAQVSYKVDVQGEELRQGVTPGKVMENNTGFFLTNTTIKIISIRYKYNRT